MTGTRTETARQADLEARRIIAEMRAAVEAGEQPWFLAVLQAVRQWPLPSEQVGGRTYRYLVGGEAFDWLLLAERLCDELDGLVTDDESEALLFHERLPLDTTEEEFEKLLGAKYKAHLNFVYGVRVEAALQMAVMEELSKERAATRIWERNGRADDEVFRRIYGRPQTALLEEFRSRLPDPASDGMSLCDYSEWRYWLFQYRVKNCDPAKVASDTRKGLALLQRLERAAHRKRAGSGAAPE